MLQTIGEKLEEQNMIIAIMKGLGSFQKRFFSIIHDRVHFHGSIIHS